MSRPLRDPDTGKLNFAVSVNVHLTDQLMPLVVECRDWQAARSYLGSPDFRRIADRVDFVALHNRGTAE